MKRELVLTLMLILAGGSAARAQQTVTDIDAMPSRWDIAGGYNFIKANAPPGDCGCFSMNGAFVGADLNLTPWFGVTGELNAGHATKISNLGQNLTLTTLMGGPRVSWTHFRYTPFAEFKAGGARGTGSYFPTSTGGKSSDTSFAYSTGGGLDINFSPRLAVRAPEIQYLHTAFPNGVNTSQHQLQIGVGVVLRFGSLVPVRHKAAPEPVSSPAPTEISFACEATNPEVAPGRPVQIVGTATVNQDRGELSYTWTTGGGKVLGEGRMVAIDTERLAPGTYRVAGRASLASNPSVASACEVSFTVKEPTMSDQTMPTKVSSSPVGNYDDDPREHLHDIFFNYDQANLRSDAQEAVTKDAAFLISRPDLDVTLAGYADERGSAEYNIALGLQRAVQTRDALVAAGVPESRIQVVSYGKEKPFCSEENEACYQQNRRAQFVINGR